MNLYRARTSSCFSLQSASEAQESSALRHIKDFNIYNKKAKIKRIQSRLPLFLLFIFVRSEKPSAFRVLDAVKLGLRWKKTRRQRDLTSRKALASPQQNVIEKSCSHFSCFPLSFHRFSTSPIIKTPCRCLFKRSEARGSGNSTDFS